MTGHEWLIPVALGTLICGGMIALGLFARYGFNRITGDLADHGKDLKEIRRAVDTCVTYDDLDKELGPIKDEMKTQNNAIVRLQAQCDARHKG